MRSLKRSPGEFELIAALVKDSREGTHTILGPGDDCAILAPSRKPQLFTIDSMVEDVHFRIEWVQPEKLGAKALAVNLSDLAAMGARPTAFVVNLAVRPGLDLRFFKRLYSGMKSLAVEYQTDLVGGNVTRADRLSITIALVGEASRHILRRDLARPGDEVFVTGTVGDSAAGLQILTGSLKVNGVARRFLVQRHLSPTPRIKAGLALSRISPASAAIDISDGLLQDLQHILERSGVGAEIDAAAIPLSPAYCAATGGELALALGGGEDYELLFCTRPGNRQEALTRRLGLPVKRIGRIVKGTRMVVRANDRIVKPLPVGFDQLGPHR